jgi:hypothetical protein
VDFFAGCLDGCGSLGWYSIMVGISLRHSHSHSHSHFPFTTQMVVPQTSATKCRYADYIPDEHLSTPDYFISHRWASPFRNLVSALFLHFDCARCLEDGSLDADKLFLWIE